MKKRMIIKSFNKYYEVLQIDIKAKSVIDSEDVISCKVLLLKK